MTPASQKPSRSSRVRRRSTWPPSSTRFGRNRACSITTCCSPGWMRAARWGVPQILMVRRRIGSRAPGETTVMTDAQMLDDLQRVTFEYFREQFNLLNGLIADKTQPGSPSSIAAVGMGLSVYVVAVERDLLSRAEAVDRTLTLLRFFHASPQGPEPDATGYKGVYYHFLDMQTGRRAL